MKYDTWSNLWRDADRWKQDCHRIALNKNSVISPIAVLDFFSVKQKVIWLSIDLLWCFDNLIEEVAISVANREKSTFYITVVFLVVCDCQSYRNMSGSCRNGFAVFLLQILYWCPLFTSPETDLSWAPVISNQI